MLKKFLFTLLSALLTVGSVSAQTVNGAGASFPYPIYSSWAHNYAAATKIQINYQSIGSGGGIKEIIAGTVDFGASDDPLTSADLRKDNLIQIPVIVGGIVPVINLDGVAEGKLQLSPKVLADIFHGKITKWNDPVIVAMNKGVKLPNEQISVVYRSDSSGTSAVFTTFLSQVSKEWKDEIGAGKSVNWPVGMGAKGNDGVAGNVKRIKNSIGYVEYAYAKNNKITWTALTNTAGKLIQPNMESFQAAAASANWDKNADYYLWLVNAPGDKSWPIAAASFILLRKDQPEKSAAAAKFFNWCFDNGDKAAEQLVYVPLPKSLKDSVRGYLKENGIKF
ncbi:MAG: phosphate ABC transporter substrate-binding protein PstS [Deferribacteraceae bacterium]|jgi:phosphate transport system substrate-binding protein|nr:phosphate ABC transporter substrate-binding protein PstS [Deferribacteraceae bacterium]